MEDDLQRRLDELRTRLEAVDALRAVVALFLERAQEILVEHGVSRVADLPPEARRALRDSIPLGVAVAVLFAPELNRTVVNRGPSE